MYIVIVGAGDIGTPLIEVATGGGNEVVVVEQFLFGYLGDVAGLRSLAGPRRTEQQDLRLAHGVRFRRPGQRLV